MDGDNTQNKMLLRVWMNTSNVEDKLRLRFSISSQNLLKMAALSVALHLLLFLVFKFYDSVPVPTN